MRSESAGRLPADALALASMRRASKRVLADALALASTKSLSKRVAALPFAPASTFLLALLLGVPISAGCGADDGGREPVVREDSAGIEIVTNSSPAWSQGAGWRVSPAPSVRIGRREGPREQTLHGVVSVRHAGDAILVAQQTELRLYDGDGALLRHMGRLGQGPGEFMRIADAVPCGNSVLAAELTAPRVTVFDPTGAPSVIQLRLPETQGRLNPLAPFYTCAEDGAIGGLAGPRQPRTNPPSVSRQTGLVVRLHIDGARLDTLLAYPGPEHFDGLTVPFGRRTMVAASDSLIYLVDTGAPELRIFGLDGSLRRIVRLEMASRAVTRRDITRIRAQYLNGLPQSLRSEVEPRLDAAPIAKTMPYFSALHVAPDGTTWLQAYRRFRDEEVTRWTVVDPTGVWLGDVELPAGLAPQEFTTRDILGVWRDQDGVEYVQVHDLTNQR